MSILVQFIPIFLIICIALVNGKMSVGSLARCIMSEASIGNKAEQIAIGFACQRNRKHASNQHPTAEVTKLAKDILDGKINDPTQGACHWYSPRSMPKETQKFRCKKPIGTGIMDCSGGLETSCGTTQNYKPNWAIASKEVKIPGVRECYYRFYTM